MHDESDPLLQTFVNRSSLKSWIVVILAFLLAIILLGLVIGVLITNSKLVDIVDDSVILSHPDLCGTKNLNYVPFYGGNYVNWPHFKPNSTTTLLKNGTLWTMDPETRNTNPILQNYDLLIQDGLIIEISTTVVPPPDTVVIDLEGRWVTPGLVDLHSHLGVYPYPEDAGANNDGNEMTGPTLPYLRALDALNPEDPALPEIRSGGVTTSLVLPGSANIMGGEAAVIKLHSSSNINDLLFPFAPRAFKMACGENPKRVYGSRGVMPGSRMGIGYLIRKRFLEAAQFLQSQEQWDCLNSEEKTSQPRPFSAEHEPLIAILKGEALLNVHCYEVQDIMMIIRTSKEFNFSVAAFHHALEAWKIPQELAENNISAATFADLWGFKMEGYDGSVNGPKILQNAGVNMALKTDHPVIFAKDFIYEACRASYYGLDDQHAMESVTINPSKALKVNTLIGSLTEGKAADVVVWDRYPLNIGAKVEKLFIDGTLYVSRNIPFTLNKRVVSPDETMTYSGTCNAPVSEYAVTNVQVYTQDSTDQIIESGTVIVVDGIVTCVGDAATCVPTANTTVFDLAGASSGVLIPGLVNVGSEIGLAEVEAESDSQDGYLSGGDFGTLGTILAYDGLKLNNWQKRHVTAALNGGVTNLITKPQGNNLVNGIGVAYNAFTNNEILNDFLIKKASSLHITVGNAAKTSSVPSISSQIAALRRLFTQAQNQTESFFSQVLAGSIPLVVSTNGIDDLLKVVNLKLEFNIPNVVIIGASEAFKIPSILQQNNISVILAPPRRPPNTFDTSNWDHERSVEILTTAGVKVGLAIIEPGHVRNLRWEAGYMVATGQTTFVDALKMVTLNIAEMFGIEGQIGTVEVGKKANFAAYNGNPLNTEGKPQLVAVGNYVSCFPKQY